MTTTGFSTTRPPSQAEGRDMLRVGVREASRLWWLYLIAGFVWIGYGMFVLSYRPGSLLAVAVLVGLAFLVGGVGQLVAATWVTSYRWLFIVSGVLGIAAGIVTFAWPDITLYIMSVFVAWFLVVFGIIHLMSALAEAKVSYWWTQLLLGIAEPVLGVWALRSWGRSLLAFVTIVGVWAIFYGVAVVFGAFTLREEGE